MQYRALNFGRADASSRTVPVTISSETPVNRGVYVEVLDHSPGGIDLSRAPLPLIESHDTGNLNIGLVENLRIDGSRLRGVARFGSSQRAQEVFNDVADGIIRSVSVGYQLLDDGTPQADGTTVFRWMPYEVSAVACPADTSVGFNRSQKGVSIMDTNTQDTRADDNGAPTRSQRRAASRDSSDERSRVQDLLTVADTYAKYGAKDLVREFIDSGRSVEQFQLSIMDRITTRHSTVGELNVGMSNSEVRGYSVLRAIRCMLPGPEGQRAMNDAGLELEASRAMAQKMGRDPQGIFIPPEALARRDLVMGTSTAGGNLVQTSVLGNEFIDILRAKTIVLGLGARLLTGVQGNIALPRKTAAATVAWVAEGSAPAEGAITFDQVSLSPKTVVGFVDYSKQLVATSSLSVESLVRDDLLAGIAVALDLAALNGSGASNQPRGVLNTSGIGSVTGGTNGAQINWGHLIDLEASVANVNSEPDVMAGYAINPKTRAWCKKTARGTNLPFIWNDEAADRPLNGYKTGVSTSMPSNGTKGTSSGVCSSLVFSSNWADLLIALWGGLDVVVDPYTQATTTTVRVTVSQLADVGVRLPASFAAFADALTA